jgi:hypothetical protein
MTEPFTADGGNSNRWVTLCHTYKLFNEKIGNERFRAGGFAISLRDALANACGCDKSYISHYSYTHGYTPDADTYEKEPDGWNSLSKSVTGWVFGLGVQLEIAPNTYPKTILIISVDIELFDEFVYVQAPLLEGKERIRTAPVFYAQDLGTLADLMYQGLAKTLDNWVQGEAPSKKIGFVSVDK